ncbi:MAG: HIT family protein [Candidatus Brocadiales bacterium]|jgi:histidine triad (HIT) family protein|nr:HIT family protein [Candidatus Brocadiales bacterium]
MRDCVFCKIARGEIPASKLLENNEVLSFLDINPVNPGHILVMPKKHYETVMDIPEKELGRVMEMVPALSRAVVKVTRAEGLNLFQTNRACAGQTIPHVHFHIIPRHSTDGFSFGWRQGNYPEGEMERLRKDIIKTLGDYRLR